MSIVDTMFRLDATQLRKMVYDGGKTLRSVELHWEGEFTTDGVLRHVTLPNGQEIPVLFQQNGAAVTGKRKFVGRVDTPEGESPIALALTIVEIGQGGS